jgi:nitrate/TMAO reductase-like tetraheme cytochrome c subunit
MTWDWSTAGVKTNGQNFVVKDANGDTIYDTQKGTFTWASNVIPQYVWFNGQVDYMTVDDVIDPTQRVKMNTLHGDASDPKARILPVKRFTGRQPYDAGNNVVAVPNLFANDATDTNAYWKTFNWTNAIASGMAYVGKPFSGQVGWVDTEFYWIENHMVAPKENAVGCAECHTDSGGRLDFAALGYEADRAARLQDLSLMTGADHRGRFGSNYLGAASCVQCHPNQVNEVMASTHYLWRTPNPKLAFPGGGSHGMIDRFCGLVGSSAMVNYFADLGNYKDSSACGKCHVGDSLPFPSPATGQFTQQQKDNVDCLICHATEGNYDMDANSVYDANDAEASHRSLMTDAQSGRRYWFQDKSLRAAESVGLQVDTASCLRCHEHGQADPAYKRGTPFNPEHDAHAAAGMTCTDCHLVDQHKMARGSRVTDMHAWERQDVEVDCVRCHTDRPHPESAANPEMQARNDHAAYLACETCHIPVTSGASRRIWTSTFGVTNGPEASVPALNPQTGMYQPYSDYTADYVARPAYRWFNGSVSMLAEPMHDASAWDFRIADKTTPGAKIYPFRPIVNGMVMDRRGFGYDPNYNTNFTMAAAMDMMAGPMKMMGFMRPEGLSDRERAVLMQFPNLVNFDKETYVKTGNAREAVNVGLGRLGMLMGGQDPWLMPDAVLSGIGSNFWSGDLLGLDLPNNPMDPTYNPAGDPTKPTGSFVSLSHAIKRNGLACADCHSATGVMDFNALKYSPDEAQRLATLLNRVELSTPTPTSTGLQLRWSTVPGRIYAVEATADLGSGQWWTVRSATNATAQWDEYEAPNSLLNTNRQLFFRVREVTP